MSSVGLGRLLQTTFLIAVLACADFPHTDSRTLAEGEYRGIRTGQSKPEALAALRSSGVKQVRPDFADDFAVSWPNGLHRFDDQPGIRINTGDVVIVFAGDEVESLHVAYIYPKWSEILSPAKTRAEMYEALTTLMVREAWKSVGSAGTGRPYLYPHDPDLHRIDVASPTADELALLERYDRWEGASVYGSEGSWQVDLLFRNGVLSEIQVDEWKGERIS